MVTAIFTTADRIDDLANSFMEVRGIAAPHCIEPDQINLDIVLCGKIPAEISSKIIKASNIFQAPLVEFKDWYQFKIQNEHESSTFHVTGFEGGWFITNYYYNDHMGPDTLGKGLKILADNISRKD